VSPSKTPKGSKGPWSGIKLESGLYARLEPLVDDNPRVSGGELSLKYRRVTHRLPRGSYSQWSNLQKLLRWYTCRINNDFGHSEEAFYSQLFGPVAVLPTKHCFDSESFSYWKDCGQIHSQRRSVLYVLNHDHTRYHHPHLRSPSTYLLSDQDRYSSTYLLTLQGSRRDTYSKRTTTKEKIRSKTKKKNEKKNHVEWVPDRQGEKNPMIMRKRKTEGIGREPEHGHKRWFKGLLRRSPRVRARALTRVYARSNTYAKKHSQGGTVGGVEIQYLERPWSLLLEWNLILALKGTLQGGSSRTAPGWI